MSMVGGSSACNTNAMSLRVGTARYASPEQREGRKYDAKTDLYSLGLILYELCMNKPATAMQLEREARGRKLPSARQWPVRQEYPQTIELMLALLEREPEKRPKAADVLARCKLMQTALQAAKAHTAERTGGEEYVQQDVQRARSTASF